MKIFKIRIQNFRSIVDSGEVNIEAGVTVIIGKNEQGKTNFLKGIASFNRDINYSSNDLPNHIRPSLEKKDASEIPIVTIWFKINPKVDEKLRSLIPEFNDIDEIKCTKYYGNNYKYWTLDTKNNDKEINFKPPDLTEITNSVSPLLESLKKQLSEQASRFPDFNQSLDTSHQIINTLKSHDIVNDPSGFDEALKTFSAAIKGLSGQDDTILKIINQTISKLEQHAISVRESLQKRDELEFVKCLATIILHSSTTDRIPNYVDIDKFVANPDEESRGMANLCRVSGLTPQKIKELSETTDAAEKQAFEDFHKTHISGVINEYWTQARYQIHFRIDSDRLFVSVSDNKYSPRIPPSDRSDGFQWYLSFYSALINDISGSGNVVLLLDNPAIELHVDGQRDIKKSLEQKISDITQIIYVTHSPAMIDPFNLQQVRRTDLIEDNKGTKVYNTFANINAEFDLLEPVRLAIGANLLSSLIFGNYNLLVEGASDKPILEGAFILLNKDRAEKIQINGSISQSKDCVLAKFYQRSKLPFLILLDADSRGRELKKGLEKEEIKSENIILLSDAVEKEQGIDFSIEDIFSVDDYHKAVESTYSGLDITKPNNHEGKITKYYCKPTYFSATQY